MAHKRERIADGIPARDRNVPRGSRRGRAHAVSAAPRGEDTELRQRRGQRARELQEHDAQARQECVACQRGQTHGLSGLTRGYRAQHVDHRHGGDHDEERHDAEHVVPPPHLSDVAGNRRTHERGQHPREREGCEKDGSMARRRHGADKDVERDDEKATAQALQRAANDEDNDRRRHG